jgi:hypothetical protein
MESFDCAATGKKLPGKRGQQELSAAPFGSFEIPKILKSLNFPTWHGFR